MNISRHQPSVQDDSRQYNQASRSKSSRGSFPRQPEDQHSRSLLEHALAYADRGWSIIPVTGKKAVGLWKLFQTQPPNERTLGHLFAREGVTGLAVILGRVSRGLA